MNQKVSSQVRALLYRPTRGEALPVYRADLTHPVTTAEHGNAVNPARLATGQILPQGGSGGTALGRPKKPRPAVMRWICPRRSGPKWQERMGNCYSDSGKQMTTNACWLVRPEVRAPSDAGVGGHLSVLPSRLALTQSDDGSTHIRSGGPCEGSSRMKGNFHVRFQGGCGRATARAYPALCHTPPPPARKTYEHRHLPNPAPQTPPPPRPRHPG